MIGQKKFVCFLGISIIAAILLISLDQMAKGLAVSYLKDAPAMPLISGVFELSYLENQGAAFGILKGQKTFFILITVIALFVLCYLYIKIPKNRRYVFLHLTFLLFISGAIGNFIDRCRNEYVIDFFYFKLIDFPVFNVADIYVSVSAVLFFLLFCFYYTEEDLDMVFGQLSFWKKKEKKN